MALGSHVQGRASLVAVATATVFAAASGYRHHFCKGTISVRVGTGAAIISLAEVDAAGSSVPVAFFSISASAPGFYPIDFGEKGYRCSATGSRVILNLESSNASVLGTFVGYTR